MARVAHVGIKGIGRVGGRVENVCRLRQVERPGELGMGRHASVRLGNERSCPFRQGPGLVGADALYRPIGRQLIVLRRPAGDVENGIDDRPLRRDPLALGWHGDRDAGVGDAAYQSQRLLDVVRHRVERRGRYAALHAGKLQDEKFGQIGSSGSRLKRLEPRNAASFWRSAAVSGGETYSSVKSENLWRQRALDRALGGGRSCLENIKRRHNGPSILGFCLKDAASFVLRAQALAARSRQLLGGAIIVR